jgi:hypothetical protein
VPTQAVCCGAPYNSTLGVMFGAFSRYQCPNCGAGLSHTILYPHWWLHKKPALHCDGCGSHFHRRQFSGGQGGRVPLTAHDLGQLGFRVLVVVLVMGAVFGIIYALQA